ncbi:MAG: hypothetical protein Q9183_007548 [Haloplaca sp. 2 TL-2023]
MAISLTSLLPYHPFKALYATLAIITVLARLPFWFLYFLPRFMRTHPSYTLRQSLMLQLLRCFLHHASLTNFHPPWTLLPGVEKDQWERIAPSKKDIYKGVLEDEEVKPVEVGGTWYPGPFSPDNQEKRKGVILHFHGGAYIVGDGRKADLGFGAGLLTRNTEYWVLSLQYRISSNPGCRFPAALQDAVTGYQFLLDKGFAANDIIVSGDSAGANLAVAFLRQRSSGARG